MSRAFVFASESVTPGHPDKLCDQISDAIVDRMLDEDPASRVIAECAIASSILFLSVRQASEARFDAADLARSVISEVGYTEVAGFNARDCTIMTSLQTLPGAHQQRLDVSLLADEGALDGVVASNHVTAFGYACDQTPQRMPLPVVLAHRLARGLDALRHEPGFEYLLPDGKAQVAVSFEDRSPKGLYSVTVVASQRSAAGPDAAALERLLRERLVEPCLADGGPGLDPQTRVFINPEGPVIGGGPALHSGLTGRKTAIDAYGEYARHSGAALSGKDPLRIDRVASYAARHLARNVVAAGLASECEVQLTYSIGLPGPVSLQVHTYGTGRVREERIREQLEHLVDLRLAGVVRRFGLQGLPRAHDGRFYRRLAVFGQMGRDDLDLPWEREDLVDMLKAETA
ncbi:methionine adenosyltransferase [Thioalkalivibrio sulfidiphilus]|uniref:methionine adenosyltransferase n=1 Tax=Thioalkalivibrio sulfidiphilus TaxID=1033854 RepID=UPI00037A2D7D|nr:methionine adenosyltransferase [Thioalkalivibrio sulfidiphilus]